MEGCFFVSEKMIYFLRNKLQEIKRLNPSFSVRTFALRAGISSGSMTELLNGRRRLTRNMAEKIATNLKLNPTERSLFLSGKLDTEGCVSIPE